MLIHPEVNNIDIQFIKVKQKNINSNTKEEENEKNKKKLTPTEAVTIKFRSQKLPEKITIYNTERKIILEPRFKFCNNCQSFGHSNYNNSCNNELICRNIGKNHNTECLFNRNEFIKFRRLSFV